MNIPPSQPENITRPKISAEVSATAGLIKKHFYAAKTEQRADGKRYNPAERFRDSAAWEAAGELCNQLSADPYDFVRAAFLYCTVPGGPFPVNMTGSAAKRWYQQWRRLNVKKGYEGEDPYAREIMQLLRETTRLALVSQRNISDFLLDEYMLPLHICPAFVRVLLLSKDPQVMEAFGRLARAEIVGNQKLLNTIQALGVDLTWMEQR